MLRSTTTGERVELNFSPTDASDACPGEESGSTLIKEILFLLECFDVSDEFYHELSMIVPDLPRSYRIKRLRSAISRSVDIKRVPEPTFGAYRPVTEYLEALICDQVSIALKYVIVMLLQFGEELPPTVLVKFSGDGTKFSSTSNYVLLTLSFPNDAKDVLAASGINMTLYIHVHL